MAFSANTPVLDQEILKLRRALSDTYDEGGNLISADTASSYYVGTTTWVATWNSAELLDIYNSACVRYIEYITKVIDKKMWHKYLRGYIIRKSAATISSGALNLDSLSPALWIMIDTSLAAPVTLADVGVEISPFEYFSDKSGSVKSRLKQLLYVFLNDGTNNIIQYLNYGSATAIDLLYIKQHVNFIHDSSTVKDVTVFTPEALERIRLMATKIAQAYKSSDIRDLPMVEERSEIELDLSPERK